MSQEVDQRVVEMRFDNAKFEKNVQQSINSLNALNESLKFEGAEKGFAEVEKASEKVDFDRMTTALETLTGKFSALEVIGMTALVKITDKAIDTGTKLAKSLSIDQVMSGWNKYAQKTASVQTIMNATGKSITKVNSYLSKLMWFSDETSYGFTDMTSALSTLTAAGGDIEKMIPMIMGMANATAYAGKGAAEFQRVVYNLAQSYGTGAIQLIDWKSVEQAGAGSQQLKQLIIDTAVELGKLKEGEVTTGTFGSTLQKKWADREVMEKAFGKYAEFAEAVNAEMKARPEKYNYQASNAIEALADQYDEVTVKAFKAAQEAKSFSEAVDATKDAVSSGWMQTFDILFGNYEEAKTFWSDLAEQFWDIFAGGMGGRNSWLKKAFNGGMDQLLDDTALGDVGDAFTKQLRRSLIASGKLTEQQIEDAGSFQKALENAGVTADDLYERVQLSLAGYEELAKKSDKELAAEGVSRETLNKTIEAYRKMAEAIQNGEVSLDSYAAKMGQMSGREHFFNGILNILNGIYNNDDKTVWTCGIRLREHVDAAGNEIWCENIWIENCIFRDIWYNPYVNNGRPCDVTGIAILPRSVHNLYIRHNFFTQNKGSACIHWNSWKKNGYAEVTGNTFYLNAYGGVAVYAVQQQFPKVKGRVCNNQFIGCGLGYLPQEWFDMIPLPDNMLGQGCAGLLGGAGTQVAPKKWTFVCENNVFEDCVESSIEGPTWNPCIGNSITGQGAAQTEENCRKMEEKYHLDYKLKPRPIDSVNFIYRNYYADADGTFPNDDDDPIVFMNNTMGVAHVPRQSYIQFKGTYNVPFIFTGNVMRTGQPHIIDTHFLYCNFKAGLRFENNDGIYPYFNNCTVCGDFIVDEIQSVWQCDFSKANLITNRGRERFPEARFTRYDPAQAGLDNDQAVMDGGYALLKAHDVGGGEEDTTPNEPVYDISADPHYNTAENAVIFDGTFGIDTGVQLFATNKDFTIIASFQLESFRGLGMPNFSFVPVLSSMNYSDDRGKSPGFDVGLILAEGISAETKPVGGFITTRNYWGYSQCPSIDMNSYSSYPNKVYNILIMRKGGVLKFYDFYMQKYGEVTGNDATATFNGTLHIGENMVKPIESEKYKMRGKVYQCKVYNKALPTKLLEEMFPNIYSNESRIKGSITCYVNNLQYLVRIARCTYLEVTLDLGKHAWPEYAGKYPKAVGIKVTGLYGFDDVIWVGTGTDGHITKWIYNGGNMKPHEPITVTIANTGLCPGLEAKLIAFRCVNLTEDSKCVPATGIGVNWAGPLTIAAGGELKGEIVLTPAGANTMKDFKMEATGDSITASTSGTALIVRAKSPGSATITVTHIGGAVYTCTINVT